MHVVNKCNKSTKAKNHLRIAFWFQKYFVGGRYIIMYSGPCLSFLSLCVFSGLICWLGVSWLGMSWL